MARLRRSRTGRGAHAPAVPRRALHPSSPPLELPLTRALRLRNRSLPPLASSRVFLRASPSPLTRFLPATLKRCCCCLPGRSLFRLPTPFVVFVYPRRCSGRACFVFPGVTLSWPLFASSERFVNLSCFVLVLSKRPRFPLSCLPVFNAAHQYRVTGNRSILRYTFKLAYYASAMSNKERVRRSLRESQVHLTTTTLADVDTRRKVRVRS